MICYICGNSKFTVHVTYTDTEVERTDEDVPLIPNLLVNEYKIISVLCSKCGILQYHGERSSDKWFTNQVSLVWDDKNQELVSPPKTKSQDRSTADRVLMTFLKNLSASDKEALRASLQGDKDAE